MGRRCLLTRFRDGKGGESACLGGVAIGQNGYHFHQITGDPGPTPYWQPPPHSEEVSRVVSDDERSERALDTSSECGISPHGWVPGFRW
jgi:hypothetical protein